VFQLENGPARKSEKREKFTIRTLAKTAGMHMLTTEIDIT
jgi:hypothetical protein